MIKENQLKHALGIMENPGRSEITENISDIDNLGKEKVLALKESIHEINLLIDERNDLSSKVIHEAEKAKTEINNFIKENQIISPEANNVRDLMALRQKQVELSEFQLKEKVSCWQDIMKLKQELRQDEQELAEKESRLNMLNKILE